MAEKNSSEENGKDLIWFYQVRVEDLRNMKRQQWIATYYGLLIITAMIVGFDKLPGVNDIGIARHVIFSIGFFFTAVCVYYLKSSQNDMGKYRMGIAAIEEEFKGKLLEVVTLCKDIKGYKSYWYDWRIFIPLNLSLVIGVSLLTLILYGNIAIGLFFLFCLLAALLYVDKIEIEGDEKKKEFRQKILNLAFEAKEKGVDVEALLRDALQDSLKEPEDYRMKT